MSSPLERLIALEASRAEYDSSGRFTFSREKALEKLAAFQLPGPASWACKLVQAAVASRCQEIHLRQMDTSSDFFWVGPPDWSPELLEGALFDPEMSDIAGLQYLKQAFWSEALHGRYACYLRWPSWSEALYWDGQELRRVAPETPAEEWASLMFSHRRVGEGGKIPFLWDIQAASRNNEIFRELKQRTFACPIPFTVDSRRMDTLDAFPGHGEISRFLQLRFCEAELPPLKLPPATRDGFQVTSPDTLGNVDVHVPWPDTFSLAAYLLLHGGMVRKGKGWVWKHEPQASKINWILDGVMIDQFSYPMRERSCSLGMIGSAQGLSTDLSGFTLLDDAEYRRRVAEVTRSVGLVLEEAEVNFEKLLTKSKKEGKIVGMVFMGASALFLGTPLMAAFMLGFGTFVAKSAGADEQKWVDEFVGDLAILKGEWSQERLRFEEAGKEEESKPS
jgi:hypothetical protein